VRQNNRTCMPAYISQFSIFNFQISNLKLPIFLLATLCSVIIIPKVSAQTTGAPKTQNSAPPAQSSASSASNAGSLEGKVEKYLRNMYAWGPQYEIKLGPAKPTQIPDLLEISVTVGLQGQSDTAIVYVTKDGKYIFRGELSDMTVDPLAETRSKLHAGNSPSMGPTDAKITLIEFADFECPSCRQLDRILRDLLPQHPEIRLVYKDFPLTSIHPWAMTAGLAGQCAAKESPASFWKIHDIIFDAQDLITPSNVWEKMSDFANQVGLNVETFRACMSNPDTTQTVEKTIEESHELNVTATPTIFVNGRRVVGPDEALLKQLIEFELNII
jgi:protein-disulfide isomerase